ncbi:hypothetical protein HMPREF9062_0699 [Actinomyces sp. oral taxon 448 str. F0400]|nr:hypothetical protein HMPREF9062_0699 [Actinomyces sp. oral taxon 448 str. F0400]
MSAERRALVDDALASWRDELIDLGGTSSLDDIALLDHVVDLTAAHPSGLAQLYAGRSTHLGNLVRERGALGRARQNLREVAGHTDLLARRFGVAPVYLAIGVASWTETVPVGEPVPWLAAPFEPLARADSPDRRDCGPADGRGEHDGAGMSDSRRAARAVEGGDAPDGSMIVRTVNAPVLLRPVRLSDATAEASLTLDPSIEVNPVLTRALRRYGSTADVEAIAHAALSAEGFTPRAALARIGNLGREYLPGFDIHERLVVGAFVHPGQALIEDFDATIERARASALVAALAGDEVARGALDVELPAPAPAIARPRPSAAPVISTPRSSTPSRPSARAPPCCWTPLRAPTSPRPWPPSSPMPPPRAVPCCMCPPPARTGTPSPTRCATSGSATSCWT